MHSSRDNLELALARHASFVDRLALAVTGHPEEAADVTQDTWLKALEQRAQGRRGFRSWFRSTVRSSASNRRRANARRGRREEAFARPEVEDSDPSVTLEALELRRAAVAAVLALEEPYRGTITARYMVGLSTRDIALRDGVSEPTVRTRLSRAHAMLREKLEDEHDSFERLRTALGWVAVEGGVPARKSSISAVAAGVGAAGVLALVVAALPFDGRPKLAAASGFEDSAELPVGGEEPLAPLEFAGDSDIQRQAAATDSGTYWEAVRFARASPKRYALDEVDAAALDRIASSRVARLDVPGEADLRTAAAALVGAASTPIFVSDRANEAARALPKWHWLRREELSVLDALDLLSWTAGPTVGWDVREGAVHFATWDELVQLGVEFSHSVEDLTIDPAPFFAEGEVPAPLFDAPLRPDDLLLELMDAALGGRSAIEARGAHFTVRGDALVVRHSRRSQLVAQELLDEVRAFRLPLPEEGSPGATTFSAASPGTERVRDALIRIGDPNVFLVPLPGEPESFPIRRAARNSKVAVLWSDAARLADRDRGRLVVDAYAGAWVVSVPGERLPARTTRRARIDLRAVLDGRVVKEEDATLERTVGGVDEFLRAQVDPASWDRRPENFLRLDLSGCLTVGQSPWVVDRIRERIESWH